jgi:radical SAM superfamily enzyme YgiQ (UPF0313 family)
MRHNGFDSMRNILLTSAGADNPEAPAYSPGVYTVLVLEAALRGAGIRADVFFYFDEFWPTARERLLEQVKERQYDIIGLSFMSYNRLEAYELLREFEKIVPRCRVIVGGIHASFLPEQILQEFTNVTAVAIGEGEEALVEFCRSPDDLESVPGIAYREQTGQVRVNRRTQDGGKSLDDQPMVDYTLLQNHRGLIPVQTTRGCVGHCVFCSWKAMEQTVRTKSPARVVKEWAAIRKLFGPDRRIAVFDALYNVSTDHVKGMCRALIDAGTTTNPWDVEMRAKPIDREMLELMKKAGCRRIMIGVETGNEKMRKKIGKGISNREIEETFALAREVKMPTFAFFITGLPGETEQTVAETIRFARTIKSYYSATTVPPQIYPGSGLYEIMKKRGLISDAYWLHRHPKNWGHIEVCGNMPLYTAEHNLPELMRWCGLVNQEAAMLGQRIPIDRLTVNDEEYDRLDPWRFEESPPEFRKLLKRGAPGTWKGRARRIVRRIKARIEITPTRLRVGQAMGFSIEVRIHRLADLYLLVLQPANGPVLSAIWTEKGFHTVERFGPLFTNLPGKTRHVWTELLNPGVGFRTPGRYTLRMIVCGASESLFHKKNWLDWRKTSFVVEPEK